MPGPHAKSLSARFFSWHRWLGWIVALQVLAWIAGGVVFTWLPFKAWVKAEEDVSRPVVVLPDGWAAVLARHLERQRLAPVQSVASVATATGPALRLKHATSDTWLALDGGTFRPPAAEDIARFARSLHKQGQAPAEVVRLASVPVRALIVQEAGGRRDVWRASFDDRLNTRLYFDARSGELTAIRNDAWVLYDFFWRLHLMDYRGGEDFSHPLVKAASLAGLALAVTGSTLAVLALRRVLRRRAHRR
jgi:hypothetical protein